MTNKELAERLHSGMFASRKTLAEAMNYSYSVIETFRKSDKIAAYTAIHVVLNTISNILKEENHEEA